MLAGGLVGSLGGYLEDLGDRPGFVQADHGDTGLSEPLEQGSCGMR
jgi:hypothetical protein